MQRCKDCIFYLGRKSYDRYEGYCRLHKISVSPYQRACKDFSRTSSLWVETSKKRRRKSKKEKREKKTNKTESLVMKIRNKARMFFNRKNNK